MPRTKVDLLEENINLLRNAIAGWSNRIEYLIRDCDIDQTTLDGLASIIAEMSRFSED